MSNFTADLAKPGLVYGAILEGVIDGIGHMLKAFYPSEKNFIRLNLRLVRRFILKIVIIFRIEALLKKYLRKTVFIGKEVYFKNR